MSRNSQSDERNPTISETNQAPAKLDIEFDWTEFQEHVEDFDMSEEDARIFLETLWSIIVGFCDLGFSVHTVESACGKHGDDGTNKAPPASGMIDLQGGFNTKTQETSVSDACDADGKGDSS